MPRLLKQLKNNLGDTKPWLALRCCMCLLLTCGPSLSQPDCQAQSAGPPLPDRFTEPVRKDGTVDYLAAVNQWGKQIPNENNFAIAVANAMHPDDWPSPEYRQAVYRHWEIQPPKPSPHMLQPGGKNLFAGLDDDLNKQPWQANDNPMAATLVQDHAPTLQGVFNALDRTQWFWPCFDEAGTTDSNLLDVTFPQYQTMRSLTSLACMQAMQHLGNDENDQAIAAIDAANQLARRVVGPHSGIFDHMVANQCHRPIAAAMLTVLQTKQLDARDLQKISTSLDSWTALMPQCVLAQGMERWQTHSLWQAVSSGRMGYHELLMGEPSTRKPLDFRQRGMDVNQGHVVVNQYFDAMQTLADNHATFAEQMQYADIFKSKQVDLDLNAFTKAIASFEVTPHFNNQPLKNNAGTQYAKAIIGTFSSYPHLTLPTHWKQLAQIQMLKLVASFRASQRKTGQWPASLTDAVAAGICPAELIQDPFKPEQNLQYRLTQGGFDLWSVSTDLDDDQGLDKEQSQAKTNDPDDEGDWVIQFRLAQ